MADNLFYVQIKKNEMVEDGTPVHAHHSYFEDGVPRLIVDTYDRMATKSIPKSWIYAIVPYVPTDEPTISVADWLELSKQATYAE